MTFAKFNYVFDLIVIALRQYLNTYEQERTIWMDGRPHPTDYDTSYMGHSIGHWEGDTLVVDVTGMNDRTWIDAAGHPHTEQLHVIERFTRTGPESLKYEITIDDPATWTKPWTLAVTGKKDPAY